MNLIAVEGIAGSGKSLFCRELQQKIQRYYLSCSIKNFMGHKDINAIMNRLILNNAVNHIPPNIVQVMDLFLMIEKEAVFSDFSEDIVIFQRYVANLYARLKCGKKDVRVLDIFRRYPSVITFYLECSPEAAYENYNKISVISYWDTDLSNNRNPEEIHRELIDYYRGEFTNEEIRNSFIRYQRDFEISVLEYLKNKPHVIIPESLTMEQKVDLAFSRLESILNYLEEENEKRYYSRLREGIS